jgi:hypothetical protein
MGRYSYVRTHTITHPWAETDVLALDEHVGMSGMPRDGDLCAADGCTERLHTGERAFAVIEVPRERRIRDVGEAWVGGDHPHHKNATEGDT